MNYNPEYFVKLKPEHHEAWNNFCRKHHWFWHRTEWLEYLCHSKHRADLTDHSFFITQGTSLTRITAIVPLIQEGDELFSPGFNDNREVLQEVKRIALENGIKRIQVNSQIRGYLNTSGLTCVLDLENIHPTKGHHSAIKKGEKYLTCELSDDIYRFKLTYFRIAGKPTRPDTSFVLLGKWIENGFGTLLMAKYGGEIVGYVYILHWLDRAYYFMSSVEPKYKDYGVGHYLQARAFETLRFKGVRWYEMGEQVASSLHHQPCEKEFNISKFKRGFGGEIINNPVSEYFFDRDFFIQVHQERIKKYCEVEYPCTLR